VSTIFLATRALSASVGCGPPATEIKMRGMVSQSESAHGIMSLGLNFR